MTFDDLKFFFEIARSGNYSRAAENLNITQPNLTKHITRLEQELGIRLFDRSTHHCRLTEDGAIFMHRTENLFFQLRSNIEDTRLRNKSKYRQIFIGSAAGEYPPASVRDLLQQYNTESTTHRYLVQQDNYGGLIEKLSNHDYDMIISTDRNARNISDFAHLRLMPMRLLLAVHKSNPKAQNPDLRPKDCTDEIVFLSLPDGKYAPPSRISDFSRRAGAPLNLTILPSPADLIANLRIYGGVAIVPNTVSTALHPDISFYEYEEDRPDMWQALLWRKDDLNPAIHSFVEAVRKVIPPEYNQ